MTIEEKLLRLNEDEEINILFKTDAKIDSIFVLIINRKINGFSIDKHGFALNKQQFNLFRQILNDIKIE